MWTEEDRAAARGPELEIVRVGRYGVMRDDAEPILGDVSPCENSEHARHRPRPLDLDRDDAGMRVRRAHDRRVHLAGKREVVAEPPAAPKQAIVLLAPDRLTDGAGNGRHAGHPEDSRGFDSLDWADLSLSNVLRCATCAMQRERSECVSCGRTSASTSSASKRARPSR